MSMSNVPLVTSKPPTCPYCGNNPTSHTTAWIDSCILLTFNPLLYPFLRTKIGYSLIVVTETILNSLLWVVVKLGMARFESDTSIITSMRGEVMAAEALRRGWKFESLIVFGILQDSYRLTIPGHRPFFFTGLPRRNPGAVTTLGWLDDKALLKAKLMSAGAMVSRGGSVRSLTQAKVLFATLRKPVIIKPRFGSRGRHTTTHITTIAEFETAFRIAKQLCFEVIVEEHLVGSVYRATMVGGKLAGVLAGDPPRITGDGVQTISQLIAVKNATKPTRVGIVVIRPILTTFLARLGYTIETILPSGLTIDLTEKIGLSYGGSSREVTPETHPKLVAELERASAALCDSIHGFDFISPDISADPDTVRWGIIECNSVPFINLHHDPLIGAPVNVAGIMFTDFARTA